MRIEQVKSLTEDELSLLLYIFNELEQKPIPNCDIGPQEITWYNHNILLWKLAQYDAKLNTDGKKILGEIMRKFNANSYQLKCEFEQSIKPMYIQLELPFPEYIQLEFKF